MCKRTAIICVVGLPGSGKTFYANQERERTGGIVLDDITSIVALKSVIADYSYIYITDPHFCVEDLRLNAGRMIKMCGEGIDISWVYFENDVEKCIKNIQYRNDGRNVDASLWVYSRIYVPPENALKIWQKKFIIPEKQKRIVKNNSNRKERKMRKVYVEAKVSLILNVDEGVNVHDFLTSLELVNTNNQGDVEDFEFLNSTVTDSK